MTNPTLTVASLVDELAAITCPVDRAEQVGLVAKQFGNLPPALARVRREALREAKTTGSRVVELAARLDLSRGWIYQLLRSA